MGYKFNPFSGRMDVVSAAGAPGSTAWGSITGTLSSQSDLNTALDAKQYKTIVTVGSSNADYTTTGTNDHTIINNALSAVNTAGGGIVRLKAGTYNLGGNILFDSKSNIVFEGAGVGATILKAMSNSVTDALHFATSSHITVKNIELDGNKATYTGNYLISITGTCSYIKLDSLYVHDSPKTNIQLLGSGVNNVIISNNDITNAGITGIVMQDTINCDTFNCYLTGNTTRDIHHYYSAGGGSGNQILNCRCVSATTGFNIQSKVADSIIKYNIVKNGGGGGIGANTGNVVVVGNYVSGTGGDDAIAVAEPTLTSAIISNNHINGSTNFNGIFVGDGCGSVTVTGNKVTNCDLGGIRLWGASYCTITGNTLYNNCNNTGGNTTYNEIWLGTSTFGGGSYPSNYNTISGNTIKTTLSPYCINLASQDYNIVTDNTLQGGTSGAINGSSTANSEIANNLGDTVKGSLTQTARIGVLNQTNTTVVYMNTLAGAGRVISEKSDFTNTGRPFIIATKNTQGESARFDTSGRLGIGQTSPTAFLHLKAGTATANTAPLKIDAGTNLGTPEDGAIEYNGTHFFATIGTTRYQLDQQSTGAAAWGSITGTLSSQTDLQTALDAKSSKAFAIAMSVAL